MLERMYPQIEATLEMIRDVVSAFPDEKWTAGFSQFQVPWKQAYHVIECLDFYFSPGVEWTWGKKFSGGWWELKDEDAPTKPQILDYLDEVKKKIALQFEEDKSRRLDEVYDDTREPYPSLIEHYIYALRHTMHHHGSLCTLAKLHGVSEVQWR